MWQLEVNHGGFGASTYAQPASHSFRDFSCPSAAIWGEKLSEIQECVEFVYVALCND